MWMGFSNEIEVAMIAINKATILEITGDDRIANPMTFGNIRRAIAAKKSTETCAEEKWQQKSDNLQWKETVDNQLHMLAY